MIVDTSAIVAILRAEDDAEEFVRMLSVPQPIHISAVTLVETRIVALRSGQLLEANQIVASAGMAIVPVDLTQIEFATQAFIRYGKGRHPAKLNLGDLFAYALAISRDEPLLFKGGDFSKTDVKRAIQ